MNEFKVRFYIIVYLTVTLMTSLATVNNNPLVSFVFLMSGLLGSFILVPILFRIGEDC